MVDPFKLEHFEAAAAAAIEPAPRSRALIAYATALARAGQAARGIEVATEARILAEAIPDDSLTVEAMHAQARCHFNHADFVAALDLLLLAARRYQELDDPAGAATALAGVGACQHRLGAQEDAIASLLAALDRACELGFRDAEVNIHNTLGSAYLALDRTDDAERHVGIGIELALTQGNRSLLTKLLHTQARIAQHRGGVAADRETALREYEKGLALAQRALSLSRDLRNRYDELHALGQAGSLMRLLGRTSEAEQTLLATLSLARKLQEASVEAEALLELGRLRTEHDGSAARRYLTEAIERAEQIDAKALQAEACLELSAQHEREGDPATALVLFKRFHAVQEAALKTARRHAARAAQLWVDYQQARREADALEVTSSHDPLTGLLNRRGLDARLADLLAASTAGGTPFTVALIDVDRFKFINDSFTHPVGDAVLRSVAALIQTHSRAGDLAVRYGGDEFLIVLAGAKLDAAARALERLGAAANARRWEEIAAGLAVSLSIGATEHVGTEPFAETIARADRALYDAKAAGRSRIVLADAVAAVAH
jgi:diguanylate cyclase (GGDEF)-like protein